MSTSDAIAIQKWTNDRIASQKSTNDWLSNQISTYNRLASHIPTNDRIASQISTNARLASYSPINDRIACHDKFQLMRSIGSVPPIFALSKTVTRWRSSGEASTLSHFGADSWKILQPLLCEGGTCQHRSHGGNGGAPRIQFPILNYKFYTLLVSTADMRKWKWIVKIFLGSYSRFRR